jgi:uncharacterized protein (DUF362 family)/NAD-dependent dihydropyrimidine dehydrogenase PreA subunit
MTRVALIRCESYDRNEVKAAVDRGIDLLGGIGRFVKKDEKILLKPNLLFGDIPEKCINTHPSVFRAAAEAVRTVTDSVSYGDHPGMGSITAAARKTGIAGEADELGIPLADFKTSIEVEVENPLIQPSFPVAKGVVESDGMISLCKLKTHALEKMTGAVKNQFGCVPGLAKPGFHMRYPDARDFGKMLVDLNGILSPRLYIMDGIRGMEGNGPRAGDPVPMNVLIFSEDPIALDAVMARLVDLDPAYLPTVEYGAQAGMGVYGEEDIELLGDPLETFINPDFRVNRERIRPFRKSGVFAFMTNMLVPKPHIDPEKCVRCGICVEACPADPKAVDWGPEGRSTHPLYDYSNCIRCYCCQEMCPESAVYLKDPLLGKIIRRARK